MSSKQETDEGSIWVLEKNGEKLVRYILPKNKYNLQAQEYLVNKIQLTFDEKTYIFTDEGGTCWGTKKRLKNTIAKKYRIRRSRLSAIVESTSVIPYKHPKLSYANTLHSFKDAEAKLDELGIPKRESTEFIDSTKANQWLMNLLEKE